MSEQIDSLIKKLEKLRDNLDDSGDEARKSNIEASRLGGEWEQEVSEDLISLSVNLESLVENLDLIISQAKSIYEKTKVEETELKRNGRETETIVDESVQEEIKERQWRKERSQAREK